MRSSIICGAALVLALGAGVRAQQAEPTFLVTSVGLGNGADLGELEGADAWCCTATTTSTSRPP